MCDTQEHKILNNSCTKLVKRSAESSQNTTLDFSDMLSMRYAQ